MKLSMETVRRTLHRVLAVETVNHPRQRDGLGAFQVQTIRVEGSGWTSVVESYTHTAEESELDFVTAKLHASDDAKVTATHYPRWFVALSLGDGGNMPAKLFLSEEQARQLHAELTPIVRGMELDEQSPTEVNESWNTCPF